MIQFMQMITVIVLSKNNESTIGRTLQSLLWCDQRIVIDDNSTDKTVLIASRYKAKIYTHSLNGDFAAQRNFGLSKARGEWVLFVDSDEIVSIDLQKEICEAIENDSISGYFVKRRDMVFGKILSHGEVGHVRLLRLAKRTEGAWRRPVHEVWEVKGITAELRNPLFHFPHPNVAQFLDDINYYSTLNANYLYKKKTRGSMIHITLYPLAKFFVNFVWFGGFLDGTAGIIVAMMMSFHSFLTRAKLYLLWRTSKEIHKTIES
jgi:glycosyltransferase involved in cell wall biosynthesis